MLKNHLESTYASAAQYNHPPSYPVSVICGGIDGANDEDILGKIFSGLSAYRPNRTCYVNPPRNLTETDVGWSWQVIKTTNLISFTYIYIYNMLSMKFFFNYYYYFLFYR